MTLSRLRPHFGVAEYALAVKAAREETGDTRDYSVEEGEQDARA